MKTLKSISLTFIFLAVVAVAFAREDNKMMIKSADELRNSFREMIVSDFTETSGFLYQNDVKKMDENVQVIFFITPEQKVNIVQVECKNPLASDYIKQLLNKEHINVSRDMIGKTYRININLVYKAN